MGIQFDRITCAADSSLTLIVDDILRQHRDGLLTPKASRGELEDWLNALQRQSRPLIQSAAGIADLEAWLDAVEVRP